jgi:hypothetical protein
LSIAPRPKNENETVVLSEAAHSEAVLVLESPLQNVKYPLQ